jgi:hypothetical protein
VEHRITEVQAVHESEDSWRCVVKGGDPDNRGAKAEIFEICQRDMFLCMAYQLALRHMNQWTWQDCCMESYLRLNDLCMQQATFYRTLAKWNIIYHKLENSPHPNAYVQCGKRPLPQLLERIPDAKDQIVAFGVKSLATLTIEGVLDLIVSTVFPRLAIQRKKGTCYCISHDKQQGAAAMTSSETVNENITVAPHNQEAINESFLLKLIDRSQ